MRSVQREVLHALAGATLIPNRARNWILRLAGHQIDHDAHIRPGTRLVGPGLLTMRQDTLLNAGCFVELAADVLIEAGAQVGYGARIITGTHALGGAGRRAGRFRAEGVTIGQGAWLGAACVVLPGVNVGQGSVIAAGAVLTADALPHGLYAGVPARRKRDLADYPS